MVTGDRTSPGLPASSSLTAVTSPLTGLYTSLAAWQNNAACEGLPCVGAALNGWLRWVSKAIRQHLARDGCTMTPHHHRRARFRCGVLGRGIR
jgi:hypothetical protein